METENEQLERQVHKGEKGIKQLKVETSKLIPVEETSRADFKQAQDNEDERKYSLEAIRKEVSHKAEMIREWSDRQGFIEDKDYRIIENILDVAALGDPIAPHEMKQFFVIIYNEYYRRQYHDYFIGEYKDKRKKENPKGDVKLYYSWGGRFLVGWDGVPFDTVGATDVKTLTVPTRHAEFQQFFRDKAGFDFPSAEMLNPELTKMSEKGLEKYKKALRILKEQKKAKTLPRDGYGLIDAIEHSIITLEDARNGEALEDLTEVLHGEMPAKMRHYADFTYNATSIENLERVMEITGVEFEEEIRLDRLFERLYNFDRQKMEEICRDFAKYLMAKQKVE